MLSYMWDKNVRRIPPTNWKLGSKTKKTSNVLIFDITCRFPLPFWMVCRSAFLMRFYRYEIFKRCALNWRKINKPRANVSLMITGFLETGYSFLHWLILQDRPKDLDKLFFPFHSITWRERKPRAQFLKIKITFWKKYFFLNLPPLPFDEQY